MGRYTEALKATIVEKSKAGIRINEIYSTLSASLQIAMESCIKCKREVLGKEDGEVEVYEPQQIPLVEDFEVVRTVFSEMLTDLTVLKFDEWKPEA